MSSDERLMIRAEGLGKCYAVYDAPILRLRQFVMPRVRKALGRAQKSYHRSFWALKGLDFRIERGETIGIVGRNGSGKSTLLQMICGTLTPTTGSVETFGRVAALLELGAGFNPDYTGRENVYMNCSVLGLSTGQIDERFEAIAAFADIGDFIEQPVKTYSSGMFARLAFAAAIHVDPELLIVDEALAVGDFAFQFKCLKRLKELAAGGCTVLFVTHDIEQVQRLCSRALYLRKGELVFFGDASEACNRYLADVRGTPSEPDLPVAPEIQEKEVLPLDPGFEGVGASAPAHAQVDEVVASDFAGRVATHRNGDRRQGEILLVSVNGQSARECQVPFGDRMTFDVHFKLSARLENPTIALYVIDSAGQFILGTNSHNESLRLDVCEPGRTCRISFECENRLRAGRFGVQVFLVDYSPAIHTAYIDYIDLAASFTSLEEPGRQRWALVSPEFDVQLAA